MSRLRDPYADERAPRVELPQASRVELAHRAHGSAVEAVQSLAKQLDTAFARLEIARERLEEQDVAASLKMPEWLATAFTHWRTLRDGNERQRVSAERMAAARRPLEHIPAAVVHVPDSRD